MVCIAAMLLALVAAGPLVSASPPGATGGNGGEAGVAPGEHGLGWLPSEADPKYKLDTGKLGTGMPLAASVDLSGDLPPIGNQGALSSCVGWATGYYYKSWWEKQEHPSWDLTNDMYYFSPAFVYNQINGGVDEGANFSDAMTLLQNTGDCDYEEFPYIDDYLKQPSDDQKEAAKQYRIPEQSSGGWGYFFLSPGNPPFTTRADVLTDLKTHLDGGEPLVMGMPVYQDFYTCGDYYDHSGSTVLDGGHAVFIAGYDDNAGGPGLGGFLVINSWGSGWNGNGEVYLSYDFVQNYVMDAWSMEDRDSTPAISGIDPSSAAGGDVVKISGTNFGASRRLAKVTFPGAALGSVPGAGEATVNSWKNDEIQVTLPDDVESGDAYVYDWYSEKSNGGSFTVLPYSSGSWYLAEGATWPGFGEWVLIQNPNTDDSVVELTFLTPEGPIAGPTYTVEAQSRTTVNVNALVPNQDVATVVTSTNGVPICAERAMYVNTLDGKWGSHDSIGSPGVSDVWYLAEGATWTGYDEWVMVMNPYSDTVDVDVTFQTPDGEIPGPQLRLKGGTRKTVHVNDYAPDSDVSTKVECLTSGRGVIAERSMYISAPDGKVGCHNSMGSSQAVGGWAVAEGATWPGFEEWILVQNPTGSAVPVHLFFLTPSEVITGPEFMLAAGSRESICVNDYVPLEDVSTLVFTDEEGQDVVVEMSMYVATVEGKLGAHNSRGSIYESTGWYLPEGCTSAGFDEWVLVMNTDTENSADVLLTFMTTEGPVAGPTETVPPSSRKSFNINKYYIGNASTKVETTNGVMVVSERAMYVNTSDGKSGAHCSLGVLSADVGQGSGGSGACALPAETISSLRSRYCNR